MIKIILRKFINLFMCCALAFSPLLSAEQLSFPSADMLAPEITQPNYVNTVVEGGDHIVTVNVTDNVGVKQVTLYYRVIGTENFTTINMKNVKNTDKYQTKIPAEYINNTGIEYYIQAMDNAENTLLHGHSFSPLSVKIIAGTDNKPDAIPETSETLASSSESDSIFTNKWFWIGVGVLVIGAAAGGGGGGASAGAGDGASGGTLTINAVEPSG